MRRPRVEGGGQEEAGDATDAVASPTRVNGKGRAGQAVARTEGSSVTQECRRLAELLHLDAVGVLSTASGRRRVAWWAAPGSAQLPPKLDDILDGRADGWIVCRQGQGAVFARMTPSSSTRSASVLSAIGASLVSAAAGSDKRSTDAPLIAAAKAVASPAPLEATRPSRDEFDLTTLLALDRAAAATRRVLEAPSAAVADVLEAVRDAIWADEVFLLIEGADEVEVVGAPHPDPPRRIPPEIRAELAGHRPSEPIDDGTARQLGVVLGARTPLLSAGFCAEIGPMEAVIAGWHDGPTLSPLAMRALARIVGTGRIAIESRAEAVDALLSKERTRWADEIHDGLTQAVTTAVLELEGLRERIEKDPQGAILALDGKKAEIRRTLDELRGLLFRLSDEPASAATADVPFRRAVQDVIERWRLPADISMDGDLSRLPKGALDAAYVVIRESLANAAKHSSSRRVAVRVHASRDALVVEVKDGGRGFATAGAGRRSRHFGLDIMRRRVEEVNGKLDIESSPGKGTRVVARLPVEAQGAKP